jgi:hypothetical protein
MRRSTAAGIQGDFSDEACGVDWLGENRRFWEASFDRLEEYLQTLQAKEKKDGGKNIGSK